jgi:thiosulfate dehydrogenase [quinone] large subunit
VSQVQSISAAMRGGVHAEDPPIAKFLFSSTKMAWFWLVVRLYVGYEWLEAGLHKVQDPNGAWSFGNGSAILGYWQKAVAIPAAPAKPAITFDWFRGFLQFLIDNGAHTWMGGLVAYGELLVGIGLILGGLVGIAAFFGALMNMNFMLAGSASTNPLLFFVAIGLILSWKIAGYYGLDRVLLPVLGTPWHGTQASRAPTPTVGTPAARTA